MTEMAVVDRGQDVAPVPDIRLVAADPAAMAESQRQLVEWSGRKRDECEASAKELRENLETAKRNKWKTTTIANALRREEQRVTFYDKLCAAVAAGFHIIPNFGGEVFAIRTERSASGSATSTCSASSALQRLPDQSAQALPVGYGEYRSDVPVGQTYVAGREGAPGKEVTRYNAYVTDFAEIDFPFSLARPEVLNATQQAMALKIFDELAALPATRKADPMVVGRIKKPWMKSWQANNHVTFLVIWFLDTNVL